MTDVNYDELFSFTAADALVETESKKKSFSGNGELYKPSITDEKCTDSTYKALVRFIPFFEGTQKKTLIERWECFLKDVNGDNGIYVVSPKTVGKRCPMRDLSYKLYKSENAIDRANSKKISVYQQYYSLIEVVKDPQHPEYEGKFFIYQFGQKIYNKIIDAETPSEFSDAINPYDFFNARLFEINLTKGTQKMENSNRPVTNYDSCRFTERSAPIHFGDGMTLGADIESKKAFIEWLENDAPKIKNYYFKEWDAETTEKVNANLASFISGYSAPKTTTTKAREIVEDIASNNSKSNNVEPAPVINEDVEPENTSIEDDDWVDSILNS